uniref:Uncharacterized protein n=1 Tax=Fundulus heteroclitus TaxID=8078 RepID=A0A3Q2P2E3_FUNHE
GSAALCRPGPPSPPPASSCHLPTARTATAAAPPAAQTHPGPLPLENDPSCLVLTSLSCSSCLWPRRYRYSMCITSVFLMREFSLNSSRILGMKPGFSFPARRNCRYRARTCFCSLLCRDISRTNRVFSVFCFITASFCWRH